MVARPRAALVPFAVLVLLVAGCGAEPEPETRMPAPGGPEPSIGAHGPTSSAPNPGGPNEETQTLPVYYVAETAAGFRLQREFHRVATSDPASAAVREMLDDSTVIDPDYRTHWPPETALRAPVVRDDGVIVVDLTGVGPAQVGTWLAKLTVQQLVFTVQGVLQSSDPVRILVDGHEVPELWGAVDTSEPIERGDPYALRSLVQIDAPADGATVGREVEVRGEAAVFEATVLWEVRRDDVVVQEGFTSTAEGQRFAPFAFTLTLEPGEYTVRIRESDPSGGEGRPVLTDDKTITVAS